MEVIFSPGNLNCCYTNAKQKKELKEHFPKLKNHIHVLRHIEETWKLKRNQFTFLEKIAIQLDLFKKAYAGIPKSDNSFKNKQNLTKIYRRAILHYADSLGSMTRNQFFKNPITDQEEVIDLTSKYQKFPDDIQNIVDGYLFNHINIAKLWPIISSNLDKLQTAAEHLSLSEHIWKEIKSLHVESPNYGLKNINEIDRKKYQEDSTWYKSLLKESFKNAIENKYHHFWDNFSTFCRLNHIGKYIFIETDLKASIFDKFLDIIHRPAVLEDAVHNISITKLFLEFGMHLNPGCLTKAIELQSSSVMEEYINAGMRHSPRTLNLMIRENFSFESIVEVLNSGIRPNSDTLLRAIEYNNEFDLVQCLLNLDVEIETIHLNKALQMQKLELIILFFEREVIPNLETLHIALESEYSFEMIQRIYNLLIKNNIMPNADTLCFVYESNYPQFSQELLSIGVKPNTETLNVAIEMGFNWNIVYQLITCGAVPNQESLCLALSKNTDKNIAGKLIELGVEPNSFTLLAIIRMNNFDLFKQFLPKITPTVCHLNAALNLNYHPSDKNNILDALLEQNIKPNRESLDITIRHNNYVMFEKIASLGVSPGSDTLNVAIRSHKGDFVRYLLKKGIKPNRISLDCALRCRMRDGLFHLILAEYFKVYIRPRVETLNLAIAFGRIPFVIEFLHMGVKANGKSLALALCGHHFILFQTLLDLKVKPDKETLEEAIINGSTNVVKKILNMGVRPDQRLVTIAKDYLSEEMVKELANLV